jgi:mono/diheme cytochrome c family protein
MGRRSPRILLAGLALTLLLLLGGPWLARAYWTYRSSNPVRRGVIRAGDLGCFSCHGDRGSQGIPDPGARDLSVPAWSGGMYMMYVKNDQDIRRYILNGSTPKVESREGFAGSAPRAALTMPSYRGHLQGKDLEDLVAAYKVLSGMAGPPPGGPEERGYQLARQWHCLSCHGAGGSGGLPDPGSFSGFIPGWYGADFKDLVRSQEEFVAWIRDGGIPRLAHNPLASYFLRRQRIRMPRYRNLEAGEVQDLWAYVRWLNRSGGGLTGP